jgi:hypothetical protein
MGWPTICGQGWSACSWLARMGSGPASAGVERFHTDPNWKDNLVFNE